MAAWLVGLLGHVLMLWPLGLVDWIDHGLEDARSRYLEAVRPATIHPGVVILDVDEVSLAAVGRWPWSRFTLAEVVERAFHPDGATSGGVRALGIDMLLSEPERTPGADERLAQSLARYPVTTGWFLSGQPESSSHGELPMPVLGPPDWAAPSLASAASVPAPATWPPWYGYTTGLAQFDAVSRSGVMNALFDTDGKVRRVPLLYHHDGQLYESLALSVWRSTLPEHSLRLGPRGADATEADPQIDYLQLQWLQRAGAAPLRIPLDAQLGMHVRWRGKGSPSGGGFDYIGVADLLSGKVAPERLRGKVALLGSTAAGLMDLRATPVHPAFAGVELHALIVAALLEQRFSYRPHFSVVLEAAGLLIMAVAWWRWGHGRAVLPAAGVALLLGIVWWVGTQGLYLSEGWMLASASPLLLVYGWLLLDTFWGHWDQGRQKKQLLALFGQYVPPQLVSHMAQDPGRYSMAPREALLTILFCDVRGFTSIAETLGADDLREYINDYLTAMSVAISERHGTLDKFIGDAVMAFWGAPVAQDDHAARAVGAALDMLRAAQALSQGFQSRGWPALEIGVGINTGEVRVGDMGSQMRRAYTVMGDAVNLASRLEGLCKLYGCALLVGEQTRRACDDWYWLEVDNVRVKGKEVAVTIAMPLAHRRDVDPQTQSLTEALIDTWDRMRQTYRQQAWTQALRALDDWLPLAQSHHALRVGAPYAPQILAALYRQRIEHLRLHPPAENWDGVMRHAEK